MVLPITYVILLCFFKEPPQYLLKNEMYEEAEKSLKFYCNYQGKTKTEIDNFYKEFNHLKETASNAKLNGGGNMTLRDFSKLIFI